MAHITANAGSFAKAGSRASFTELFWDALTRIAENNPRLKRVRKLQALSDAELDALGIARQDIPHLVFRDVYYA